MQRRPLNRLFFLAALVFTLLGMQLLITYSGQSYLYSSLAHYHRSHGLHEKAEHYYCKNLSLIENWNALSAEHLQALCEYGDFLIDQGDGDSVFQALEGFPLDSQPALLQGWVHTLQAQAWMLKGEPSLASPYQQRAIEIYRGEKAWIQEAEGRKHLGYISFKEGNEEQAASELQHSLDQLIALGAEDSSIAQGYSWLASVHLLQEQWEEAEQALKVSLNLWPKGSSLKAQAFVDLAQAQEKQRRLKQSEHSYRAAIELFHALRLFSEENQARLALAELLIQFRQTERGEKELRKAWREPSLSPSVALRLAQFLRKEKHAYKEAEELLQKSLHLNAKNSSLLGDYSQEMALNLKEQRRLDEAQVWQRRAQRIALKKGS